MVDGGWHIVPKVIQASRAPHLTPTDVEMPLEVTLPLLCLVADPPGLRFVSRMVGLSNQA